jgi:hypothetical protein
LGSPGVAVLVARVVNGAKVVETQGTPALADAETARDTQAEICLTGQVAARAETGEARMETLATAGTAAAPGEAVPGVVEAVQLEGAGHDLPLG